MTKITTALVRAALPRSPHEHAIVGAIARGATVDTLLQTPGWTVDDVSKTMQRYGLVATEEGRLVRKLDAGQDLLHLAQHSPSPHVRKCAAEAAKQLEKLRGLLAQEAEHADREAEKARQRLALSAWRDWLKAAIADTSAEIRRLRPRPTAVRPNGS